MADYPTTPVLDDFNRADIQPLDGNWEVPAGVAIDALLLSTLQAVNTLNPLFSIGLWTGSVPTADCEVFLTLKAVPYYSDIGLSNSVILLSNAAYVSEHAQWRANALFVVMTGGVGRIGLGGFYADGGGWGGGIDQWFTLESLAIGDSFALRTAGGRRIALYRPVGGEWSRVGHVDSVYQPEVGQLGVVLVGAGNTGELDENGDPVEGALAVDDFGGGEAQPDLLTAPTVLSATAVALTQIDLAWTDNSNDETGFEIERSLTGTGDWTALATVAAETAAYADTAVEPDVTYYYRVRAINALDASEYSNVASARIDDFMITEIANAVIDILAADADLTAIKLFIRGGTPLPVAQHQYPFVEVLIGEETPVDELTGGVSTRTYRGLITVTALLTQTARADWLEPVSGDARRAHVGSYDLIKRLVMCAQAELQRAQFSSLNDLTTDVPLGNQTVHEVVTAFRLDGPIVYGLDDRNNNYENFGSIPFVVDTERTVE